MENDLLLLMDLLSETYESAMKIPVSRRYRLLEEELKLEKQRADSYKGLFGRK